MNDIPTALIHNDRICYTKANDQMYYELIAIFRDEYLSAINRINNDQNRISWRYSPVSFLDRLSSATIGSIAEHTIARWCQEHGIQIGSREASGDMTIHSRSLLANNKYRVEVKFSSLWQGHQYRFSNIRSDDYDLIIFLGLSPFDAHCWILTKGQIMALWGDQLPYQHYGSRGNDVVWASIPIYNIPYWADHCGGSLELAMMRLKRLLHMNPTYIIPLTNK